MFSACLTWTVVDNWQILRCILLLWCLDSKEEEKSVSSSFFNSSFCFVHLESTDFEFADNIEEVLGSGPFEGSLFQNSSSESHSSGLSRSSIVGGVLESTKVPTAQSECKNDSLDETVTYESHGAFSNNPSQPSKGNCRYNISLDVQHLQELDNYRHLAGSILTCKKEKGSIEKGQPSALREKRFRKPTQRYIEEFSNASSKEKVPPAGTKTKHSSDSSCNVLHIRIKSLKKSPSEKSSNENSEVMLPELQVRKARQKKEVLFC